MRGGCLLKEGALTILDRRSKDTVSHWATDAATDAALAYCDHMQSGRTKLAHVDCELCGAPCFDILKSTLEKMGIIIFMSSFL